MYRVASNQRVGKLYSPTPISHKGVGAVLVVLSSLSLLLMAGALLSLKQVGLGNVKFLNQIGTKLGIEGTSALIAAGSLFTILGFVMIFKKPVRQRIHIDTVPYSSLNAELEGRKVEVILGKTEAEATQNAMKFINEYRRPAMHANEASLVILCASDFRASEMTIDYRTNPQPGTRQEQLAQVPASYSVLAFSKSSDQMLTVPSQNNAQHFYPTMQEAVANAPAVMKQISKPRLAFFNQ